jgi:hypothetical protein
MPNVIIIRPSITEAIRKKILDEISDIVTKIYYNKV